MSDISRNLQYAARMLQLLRIVYRNRPMTVREIAEQLGVGREAVRRYIALLEGPPLYIPFLRVNGRVQIMEDWRF